MSNLTINTEALALMKECISQDGDRLYNKINIGLVDDCSVLNMTTMMLVDYLLTKLEPLPLECLIPCDVEYSTIITSESHGYLNKFLNFANSHCAACKKFGG
jgi:hypothetical protein